MEHTGACAGVRCASSLSSPTLPPTRSLLIHLGEPTTPPRAAPARGPPLWEQAAQFHWDDTSAPAPEYVFDQRVRW